MVNKLSIYVKSTIEGVHTQMKHGDIFNMLRVSPLVPLPAVMCRVKTLHLVTDREI